MPFNTAFQFWTQLMTRSSESPNGVTDWQPFLYSLNIDLCRVLKNRYNYVAKMIFELIDGHSNLNHSCPYLVSSKYFKYFIDF